MNTPAGAPPDLEPPAAGEGRPGRARPSSPEQHAPVDGLVVLDANSSWTRDLFSRLAAYVPVLFVEPRDARTAWQAGWRFAAGYGVRELSENLYARRYVLPPGWLSRWFAPFERHLASGIRQWQRRIGVERLALAVSYPHYASIIERLQPAASMYYWSDDFRSYEGWSRDRVAALEHRAVEATDFTSCASHAKVSDLAAELPQFASRIGVLIHGFHPPLLPDGVRKSPAWLPADVAHLPRPVLGHWGAVSDNLDFAIVHALATAFPQASLLFIGPVVGDLGDQLSWYDRCRRLSNVHFAGPRPYETIAEYVPAFDVCLALYRPDQPFTSLTNPSTIRDYLATTRPIVSTAVPDVVRCWPELIRVAPSVEAYVAHVADLLKGGDRTAEDRLAYVRAHTWERAAERVWLDLTAAATKNARHF